MKPHTMKRQDARSIFSCLQHTNNFANLDVNSISEAPYWQTSTGAFGAYLLHVPAKQPQNHMSMRCSRHSQTTHASPHLCASLTTLHRRLLIVSMPSSGMDDGLAASYLNFVGLTWRNGIGLRQMIARMGRTSAMSRISNGRDMWQCLGCKWWGKARQLEAIK